MKRSIFLLLLLVSSATFAQTDTITIISYNLLNFPEGRNDCSSNTVVPDRADTLRKILSYAKPDIFVACEIQTEAGADSVLTRSLNVYGASNYASATYHDNTTGPGLQNQLYYNTNKLVFYSQDIIVTGIRDIDHYVLYANDPNLGTYFDTTFIEVYMCHLKAGSSSSDQQTRANQTQLLMDYIATRPLDRHHFVCGDMNVYTSNEQCYTQMTSGTFGLNDPINSPGNWNNNSSFAAIHTQSTRSGQNLDCGSTGGSDDRFDQILVSSNVMNGADSIQYLSGSYRAIGNDGNHYNSSLISAPTNSMYPDSVVKALYYMSDHLPVSLKAVIHYPTSNGLALYPVVTPVTCAGGSDGEATIVPNDGQPPYSYQWDAAAGNQTTATATGLSSGSYCVVVTDNLGEVDDYCLTVGSPASLSYSTFLSPDAGGCTGEAHLLISGGTQPYTISWNDQNLQSGQSAYNLCAGNYEATVTDDNGCETVIPVSIQYVGLEELIASKIEVYPNPFENELRFNNQISESEIYIKILDMTGRVVFRPALVPFGDSKISVNHLETGMYNIVFTDQTGNFLSSKRVVHH